MAVTKVLARGWTFEVDDGTGTSTFVAIGGINTFSISSTKNDADITDFDSGGWLEHIVASRGRQITIEGFHLEDPVTGTRDPGQAAVEELADKVGLDSLGEFRVTSPGGNEWTFKASADVTAPAGGNDDPASWSATLTVSGKITKNAGGGGS